MKRRLIVTLVLGSAAVVRTAAASENPDVPKTQQAVVSIAPENEFGPMTRSERLRSYITGTFGLKALANTGAKAELNEIRNNPHQWGRTAGGYGKRLGSGLAQHVIRGTLQYGASSLLHEDNRYFRSHGTGFWQRTRYAVASSFLARRDNGSRRFSFSRVGSAAGSSFISRAWIPGTAATAGAGAASFGITIGIDVGFNMLHEFWPDIKSHLRRHKA
jgi:hypothetical protein